MIETRNPIRTSSLSTAPWGALLGLGFLALLPGLANQAGTAEAATAPSGDPTAAPPSGSSESVVTYTKSVGSR